MRLLLVAALATLVLGAAAEDGLTVNLAKRGNVRYGPSTSAAVAVTLDAGTPVKILGTVVINNNTWYQIRFPEQGKAWMHDKVLKDLGDGRFEVTTDKARVRDDSTLGGNIVAELQVGDIVLDRTARIGDWIAVYPTTAVAYVHELLMPKGNNVAQVQQVVVAQGQAVDAVWKNAKLVFVQWAAVNDLQKALTLDWAGLSAQLGEVASKHSSVSVRIEAQRYKDGVDAVVKEQKRMGAVATTKVPEPAPVQAPTPVQAPAPVQAPQPPVVQAPVAPAPIEPVAPLPAPVPAPVEPVAPAPIIAVANPAPAPAPEVQRLMGDQAVKITSNMGGYAAEGFLEQRGDIYVIFDNASRVVAHLKPNGDVQLSEYFWRQVGVKGHSQGTVDVNGVAVPIILVDDVVLLGR